MTPKEPPRREPSSSRNPVRHDCIEGVRRATRVETASCRKQWRHGNSVEAQRKHGDLPQGHSHAHHLQCWLVDRRTVGRASVTSEKTRLITGTVTASLPGFAMTTTS